jgi:hypothetical protein
MNLVFASTAEGIYFKKVAQIVKSGNGVSGF